jgi:hypothetical protein
MTNAGKYVDFPIGYPPYLAPECLQDVDGTYYDKVHFELCDKQKKRLNNMLCRETYGQLV